MVRQMMMALVIVALIPTMTACAPSPAPEDTKELFEGADLTDKVRNEIAKDEQLSIFDIDVAAHENVVQLSGFVESEAQKSRAEQIARKVEGVREVRNNLEIKPSR